MTMKDGSAVVISKEDYDAMAETFQVLSAPGMLERIEEAKTAKKDDLIPLENAEW